MPFKQHPYTATQLLMVVKLACRKYKEDVSSSATEIQPARHSSGSFWGGTTDINRADTLVATAQIKFFAMDIFQLIDYRFRKGGGDWSTPSLKRCLLSYLINICGQPEELGNTEYTKEWALRYMDQLRLYIQPTPALKNERLQTELNVKLFRVCCQTPIDLAQLNELLERRADPNYRHNCDNGMYGTFMGFNDYPMLHVIAGKENSIAAAQLLIGAGAQIDMVDSFFSNTPLLMAIAKGDANLALFFIAQISASADATLQNILSQKDTLAGCQNSPLILALKKGMYPVALALIRAHADLNASCTRGNTAMHWACMLRNNEIINELIRSNAETRSLNSEGRAPYEYYVYRIRIIDLLFPFGGDKVGDEHLTNMHEFSDLWFHFDFEGEILESFVTHRNAAPVDQGISTLIYTPEADDNTMESRHSKIASEQYSFIRFEGVDNLSASRALIYLKAIYEVEAEFNISRPTVVS